MFYVNSLNNNVNFIFQKYISVMDGKKDFLNKKN